VIERKPEATLRRQSLQTAVWITITGVVLSFFSPGAHASSDGDGELSAMTGAAAGSMGAHPVVGGSAGVPLSRYAMVLAETSIIPLGDRTLLPVGPFKVKGSDLFDFNIALRVRIPIKRWEPYALLGTAVLMNSYLAAAESASGPTRYMGQRHSKFGLETGAGCSYYIQDNWGIRMEYRYTSSSNNFSRILVGVFYQIQGESLFKLFPGSGRRRRTARSTRIWGWV
jgi:hypothetical protein